MLKYGPPLKSSQFPAAFNCVSVDHGTEPEAPSGPPMDLANMREQGCGT